MDVHVLDRGRIENDLNYPLEGAVTATASNPNPDAVRAEGVVFNLLVETPEGTLLWDTGSHPDAGDGHWPEAVYDAFTHHDATDHPLPDALDDVGYDLADVDYVVQSHLHVDHAGGLGEFAGADVPVFVHETELKHAYFAAKTGRDGAYVAGDFDHDLDWRPLHGDGGLLLDGVEWVHLPGHTPGLIGLLVERDDGGDLLVVGDEAYVAANYEHEHPMGRDLLWSRPEWEASLRRCKDLERRHDATVVFGHDPDQFERFDELL